VHSHGLPRRVRAAAAPSLLRDVSDSSVAGLVARLKEGTSPEGRIAEGLERPLHRPQISRKLCTHLMCIGVPVQQIRKATAERTNIVLDSKLVDRVKRLAGVKTTRDAVHVALEHYVRSRDYSEVLALRGTGGISEGYDPKAASPRR
jgi:Arc/MetJ family transcription regulator